ncbi:1-phosphatidylinositol-4,5-bisphosphate phosphodiesterase 1 [Dentipellis sp. KUC8613]|nr:1-phosphatidylinositol-4,5-bisphosphate phosphodiesterase 1 [Dentipellis sp. KUC8613]
MTDVRQPELLDAQVLHAANASTPELVHPEPTPEAVAQKASIVDFTVPQLLQQGTPMIKVSAKKQKRVVFRLDPDQGQIIWETKKHRIIPIENIKELRSASDARYYREQFQLSQEYESRWLTIIYVLDGQYKTWHVVAPSRDVFQMWDVTLRKLYAVRQELMRGLGNVDLREAVWEKQYWKGADEGADQKLYFEDVEKLCKRLNINPSREDLLRRFQQADAHNHGYLDFTDFQRFVKLLKTRPEIDRLYKKLCAAHHGVFNFRTFEHFMREQQKSSLSVTELKRIWARYATPPSESNASQDKENNPPPQNPVDLALNERHDGQLASTTKPAPDHVIQHHVLTSEAFTSFLLSPDNAAFSDQHGRVFHDMTRPLPEYYISSSHNTYLVGHQLVGYSTIEGYIRALLHSCRSVELDIFDGDTSPVIYHGKTLTSKVPVREVCQAIAKYAFVVSPYPIIISAEIHCNVAQQELLVQIMKEVFGAALVCAPLEGSTGAKIERLPSPEDLKGRVLLKAKNLYVSESEGMRPNDITIDTESSSTSTETSSNEGEVIHAHLLFVELKAELKSEIKSELHKARNVLTRRSPSHNRRPSQASAGDAPSPKQKARMSLALVGLLVYTVGVKCRGLNKKEHYAPEHMFSLSETTANRMLKQGTMSDLIKHCRTHLVRVYPKGMRLKSTNYEPHRYWSAGAQLVAINWQTCDLGYMINHAMFQRNGRSGYVLKPLALRAADKELLARRTRHFLDVTVISAQQLPRPKDAHGREVLDKGVIDPYVEVSVHVPDWTHSPLAQDAAAARADGTPSVAPGLAAAPARMVSYRTSVVKNNGFNPVWEEALSLPFDCVGDMRELVFVRFAVKEEGEDEKEPLAVYCISLGSLQEGFRHLPLHDSQLSQYLFSTLFVQINIRDE